ncbi:MAG: alkaline phosphatase [Pseudomonadota bacterium]
MNNTTGVFPHHLQPVKRLLKLTIFLIVALAIAVPPAMAGKTVKNVIVMVPDGCSQSIQTLARWYKGESLTLDGMVAGMVKTYMADSIITDSASAATAFSSGYKTSDGFLGVGPSKAGLLSTLPALEDDMPYKPLATVLEGARVMGKATGMVATSSISHATPAAFASHIHSRSLDNEIMEQLVYENIDVIFGGGKSYLLPTADGGKRTDGENLLQVLLSRGYQFVETRDQMMTLSTGKAWGLFNASHMQPDIDRAEFAPTEPSLAEMTDKAIDLLSQDDDGFFLMVEGSQVDWAGHANDPIYMVTDFIAFDNAVKIAVDYAKAHKDTLVVVFPDHNTGALSLGSDNASVGYTKTKVENLLDPLAGMKITAQGVANKIGSDTSSEVIKANLLTWWGITATDTDVDEILNLVTNGSSLSYAIAQVISKNYTIFGWTTHGHSGEDVPLWSYGPDRPTGLYDNTELAHVVADAFGFDLNVLNDRLFVNASTAFLFTQFDETDPANPVLKVGAAELPFSKNILRINGQETLLEGLVVYAPKNGNIYVPRQAINLINNSAEPLPSILLKDKPADGFVAPEGTATFNFITNTLHVPCFNNGNDYYWLDLTVNSFTSPMTFKLTDFGFCSN